MRAHLERGDLVVLASEGFAACLDPIARHVGVDATLGSTPRSACGVYSGAVDTVLTGAAKGAAVRRRMAEHGIASADWFAYGDHASDLSMLLQVGNPVVVGADPVLAEYAERCGWRRLPGCDAGTGAGALAIAAR